MRTSTADVDAIKARKNTITTLKAADRAIVMWEGGECLSGFTFLYLIMNTH